MSPKISAGLLMYRIREGNTEVLLAHYGGPLWVRKDLGSWTVIKGEVNEEETNKLSLRGAEAAKPASTDPSRQRQAEADASQGGQSPDVLLGVAKREFHEETGIDVSGTQEFIPLGEIKQRGGKIVHAWAFQDVIGVDPRLISVNPRSVFEMEWPPHSGQIQKFPEIDRAEWFSLDIARQKINPAQVPFLDRLSAHLSSSSSSQT